MNVYKKNLIFGVITIVTFLFLPFNPNTAQNIAISKNFYPNTPYLNSINSNNQQTINLKSFDNDLSLFP